MDNALNRHIQVFHPAVVVAKSGGEQHKQNQCYTNEGTGLWLVSCVDEVIGTRLLCMIPILKPLLVWIRCRHWLSIKDNEYIFYADSLHSIEYQKRGR